MAIDSKQSAKLITERPLLLGLLWLVVNALLYSRLGIRIVFDSHRYLAYAEAMATGNSYWQQAEHNLYSSYTVFLYLFLYLLHLPVWAVIAAQTAVAGLASYYLYKTLLVLTNCPKTAFTGLLLYTLWPEIQQWNFYIHTESLYISATIFLLYNISKRHKSAAGVFAVLLLLLFSLFLRPNGFFLLIGTSASAIYSLRKRYGFRLSNKKAVLAAVIIGAALACAANVALEIYSPIQYLQQGQVIQGYSGLRVRLTREAYSVSNPVLEQLWATAVRAPYAYAKLLCLRFTFLWAQARPYYSAVHNVVIFLYFTPVYAAALYGITRMGQHHAKAFMLVVAALQTIMSLVIAVDWDNRFIVPLLPFVFIFAAVGIHSLRAGPDAAKP